jgi:hypothetical protein
MRGKSQTIGLGADLAISIGVTITAYFPSIGDPTAVQSAEFANGRAIVSNLVKEAKPKGR